MYELKNSQANIPLKKTNLAVTASVIRAKHVCDFRMSAAVVKRLNLCFYPKVKVGVQMR